MRGLHATSWVVEYMPEISVRRVKEEPQALSIYHCIGGSSKRCYVFCFKPTDDAIIVAFIK